MKTIPQKRAESRERRHRRVRRKIRGTAERPRLSVYRSLKHITAQLHDDVQGRCLITVTSLSPEVKSHTGGKGKSGVSTVVGKILAERAAVMGLTRVVFDRSGYRYHGRVKLLAEGAREGGLEF